MLSGTWLSTWRPAQDIRFQRCTQCQAVQQRKQQTADTVIQPVLREARRPPSIQLPGAASISRSRQSHDTGHAFPDASDDSATVYTSATGPAVGPVRVAAEPHKLQQQQAAPMPSRKIRPSLMDFDVMYQQLDEWKQWHMTAHVPRFCFDAPELGAWVRSMRKLYKDAELEQWKIERLNLLQFEWEITDQDARWHHLYHQLRRYQLLHGSTDVDIKHNEDDGCDWSQVAWWLRKQARLLAKRKLSSCHHNMLSHLGVTLRIPKRIVTRTAALQALNGPERRKLRKKWKHLDAAAAEEAWEEQQQKLEQQQEQKRQQEDIASRRLMLLQDAAEAGVDSSDKNVSEDIGLSAGARSYGVQGNLNGSSSSSDSVTHLLQQQYLAQLGLLQHEHQRQQQQQQQRRNQEWRAETSSSSSFAAGAGAAAGAAAGAGSSNSQQQSAGGRGPGTISSRTNSSWNGTPGAETARGAAAAGSGTDDHHDHTLRHHPKGMTSESPAVATSEAGDPQLTPVAAGGQLQQQQHRQQQQQQQQPGLLYQRNRRYKRVSRSTKQERWMSAMQ